MFEYLCLTIYIINNWYLMLNSTQQYLITGMNWFLAANTELWLNVAWWILATVSNSCGLWILWMWFLWMWFLWLVNIVNVIPVAGECSDFSWKQNINFTMTKKNPSNCRRYLVQSPIHGFQLTFHVSEWQIGSVVDCNRCLLSIDRHHYVNYYHSLSGLGPGDPLYSSSKKTSTIKA
jgi:hypothetical protein